ncbi:MAG: YiiD C-terminal domain-containing protein [Rhodanobacteraceae bacterium]
MSGGLEFNAVANQAPNPAPDRNPVDPMPPMQHNASNNDAERERMCATLERKILAEIPLARTMQLSVRGYDGVRLTLSAALAPNINDKGCAFGGSLVSLMTLAAWGLIKLALDASGVDCDIYVKDSRIRYLAPVWQDFDAIAELAEDQSFAAMFDAIDARGKAGVETRCHVPLADRSKAAMLVATFVAIVRS